MVKKEGLFEVEKWLEREEKPLPKGKRKNKDYRDRKTELSVPVKKRLYFMLLVQKRRS
jgi:hypothetical protein